MDGLTAEIVERLSAPFEPHEYGIRVGAKDKKDGKWVMWLVYVEEDAIVDRLNAVTPNWTWEIRNVQAGDGYIAAYGRLTINGVSREGVGTGSPDTGTKIGENEEKGAATDALKRCARLFGIGLELKREDFGRVKTDGSSDDWKAKAEALSKFTAAYNKVFGTRQSSKPAPVERRAVQPAPANVSKLEAHLDAPDEPAQPNPFPITIEKVKVHVPASGKQYIELLPGGVISWTRQPFRDLGIECENWTEANSVYTLPEKVSAHFVVDGTLKKLVRLEKVAA